MPGRAGDRLASNRPVEEFTADEQRALAPYFSNLTEPVFALTDLPETVKGALFARYSRSSKSLRRLFLDEFLDRFEDRHPALPGRSTDGDVSVATARADRLYSRVFDDYGDDSVAQLGAAHLACEGVSNILTKVLERGRLMSYLEQSTRYVPYTDRTGTGRWKYHVPEELASTPFAAEYERLMDLSFETYARWLEPVQQHFRRRHPQRSGDSDAVYRASIRAKALDTLRGLLPAAVQSNVGLFGTGQAYEALLLRMRAHPLAEVQACARAMLTELRKVIPAFLTRVDRPDRGGRWSEYLRQTADETEATVARLLEGVVPEDRDEVTLVDFDPDAEVKIVAAAMYAVSDLPDDQLLRVARALPRTERLAVLRAYTGSRTNRRHKPGRAFERAAYRFDVLADYGAFRDLQRHRLLTLDWQTLTTQHGYIEPEAVREVGGHDDWVRVMNGCGELEQQLRGAGHRDGAQYAVPMAYRIRFYVDMNAREAMHMIELRTAPQGHPAYRRICQAFHNLIADQAGHRALAAAVQFADHTEVELERLQAERASERRRQQRAD